MKLLEMRRIVLTPNNRIPNIIRFKIYRTGYSAELFGLPFFRYFAAKTGFNMLLVVTG